MRKGSMRGFLTMSDAEWLPIASAPKGLLLIYWPATVGRNAMPSMIRVDYAGSTPNRLPTHWMPLPPAPNE